MRPAKLTPTDELLARSRLVRRPIIASLSLMAPGSSRTSSGVSLGVTATCALAVCANAGAAARQAVTIVPSPKPNRARNLMVVSTKLDVLESCGEQASDTLLRNTDD